MRDAAAMAAQSDPANNRWFKRRWHEEPPKRERLPQVRHSGQAHLTKGTRNSANILLSDLVAQRADSLDAAADVELRLGHILIAERLAAMAAELRVRGAAT